MDKNRELAIELSKAAIQNNSVKFCISPTGDGFGFILDRASFPEGKKLTFVDFKQIVKYFEKQLQDIQ